VENEENSEGFVFLYDIRMGRRVDTRFSTVTALRGAS